MSEEGVPKSTDPVVNMADNEVLQLRVLVGYLKEDLRKTKGSLDAFRGQAIGFQMQRDQLGMELQQIRAALEGIGVGYRGSTPDHLVMAIRNITGTFNAWAVERKDREAVINSLSGRVKELVSLLNQRTSELSIAKGKLNGLKNPAKKR